MTVNTCINNTFMNYLFVCSTERKEYWAFLKKQKKKQNKGHVLEMEQPISKI